MEYDKIRGMKYLFVLFFLISLSVSSLRAMDETDKQIMTLKYVPATMENLSRLLWRYNYYDVSDDTLLDEYARVIMCDIHEQYYKDEFSWVPIRNGLRHDIQYYSSTYPDRFEIIATVPIDRYDIQRSALKIRDESQLTNAGSIIFPLDGSERCPTWRKERYNYPHNIKFSADNQFSLTHIPVSPDQARLILDQLPFYKASSSKRTKMVTVRFRIKVNGVKNVKKTTSFAQIILRGQLDEIAFFVDRTMTKKIWAKSFTGL